MRQHAKRRGPVSRRKTSATVQGSSAKRAERMPNGRYRLLALKGRKVFPGTLFEMINKGKVRIAMFSVPKG